MQLHVLQHTMLSPPSLSPRVCSDSCPLSQWCHPTISSSIALFSSCPQSFPSSGSFPMSWLFPPGGQSIGASVSVSVLSMNIQGWFPLGLTGLISLQSEELSRVFYNTTVWKHQFLGAQLPGGSDGKASAYNVGDPGSIPRLGRSPGEGNGNPLQYSCLENPMDGGAWCTTVHGVTKSRTWLSDFTFKDMEKPYLWLYRPLLAKWCLCFLIHCLILS